MTMATPGTPAIRRPARRLVPILVLVSALLALVGSVGWVVVRAGDGRWPVSTMYGGLYGPGPGMMMGSRAGAGRDGIPGDGQPVTTLDAARARAQRFAEQLGGGVRAGEVMQFTSNFYAELVDSQGRGTTEVLINPDDGAVGVEYGPAMMWNSRYGMPSIQSMPGMRHVPGFLGLPGLVDGDRGVRARVSAEQAQRIGEGWLRERGGLTAGPAEQFPGYYTLHTLRDGQVVGMLSVHAVTGDVWYHSWHGRFVAMSQG